MSHFVTKLRRQIWKLKFEKMKEDSNLETRLIHLIYETAEDTDLWPKLLEEYKSELLEVNEIAPSPVKLHNETPYLPPEKAQLDAPSSRSYDDLNTHLQRALRLNQLIEKAEVEAHSAKRIIDSLPIALITVRKSGEIVNYNSIAAKILETKESLYAENGKLKIKSERYREKLYHIINSSLSKKPSSKDVSLKLEAKPSRGFVSVFAIKSSNENAITEELCTLFITTNAWTQHVSTKSIRYAFQLSEAEARLAKMLVSGDALSTIAETLGISHNTARNQLKSIFAKTSTNRQAELVGLLLSTPNIPLNALPKESLFNKSKSNFILNSKKQCLKLKSGKKIVYEEIGDPKGEPIIYIHEFIVWRWWQLTDSSKWKGIKLLLVYRPGFSGSDMIESPSYREWTENIGELINYLGLERFCCLGFSTGCACASAIAHAFPTKCVRLALVSGSMPFEKMDELEGMKPHMSHLIGGLARHSPLLYRKLFSGILKTAYFNAHSYLNNYVKHWSDYDRQLIKQDSVIQSFVEGFRQIMNSDTTGLVHEALVNSKPLGFSIEDIQVATDVWRGEDDRAVSIKLAARWAQRIPNSTEHVIKSTGHLLVLEYWEAIFQSLLQSMRAEVELL